MIDLNEYIVRDIVKYFANPNFTKTQVYELKLSLSCKVNWSKITSNWSNFFKRLYKILLFIKYIPYL